MARPKKSNMDYFPHDCNAFNDVKIEKLTARHGIAGYGVFWYLLEKIYNESNAVLTIDSDFILISAKKIGIKKQVFEEIIKTCVQVGIFSSELYNQNKLSSNGIQKRFKPVSDKRLWNNNKQSNNMVSEAETPELIPETHKIDFNSGILDHKEKQRKEKQRKEKQIKEKEKEKEKEKKEETNKTHAREVNCENVSFKNSNTPVSSSKNTEIDETDPASPFFKPRNLSDFTAMIHAQSKNQ